MSSSGAHTPRSNFGANSNRLIPDNTDNPAAKGPKSTTYSAFMIIFHQVKVVKGGLNFPTARLGHLSCVPGLFLCNVVICSRVLKSITNTFHERSFKFVENVSKT